MQSNEDSIVLCMDNHVHMIDIDSREEDTVSIKEGVSIKEAHPKILNQCDLLQSRLLTCSRDPVIKLFDIQSSNENRLLAEFKGHEMSVTTAA